MTSVESVEILGENACAWVTHFPSSATLPFSGQKVKQGRCRFTKCVVLWSLQPALAFGFTCSTKAKQRGCKGTSLGLSSLSLTDSWAVAWKMNVSHVKSMKEAETQFLKGAYKHLISCLSLLHLERSGNSLVAGQPSQTVPPPQVQIPWSPWIHGTKMLKHQTLLCSLQVAEDPSSSWCQVGTEQEHWRQGGAYLIRRAYFVRHLLGISKEKGG